MTRSNLLRAAGLGVAALLVSGLPVLAADNASPAPQIGQAIRFAVSPPLRELAKLPRQEQYGFHLAYPPRRVPKPQAGLVVDTAQHPPATTPSSNYTVGLSWLGVGNGFGSYTVPDAPTDDNMGVGDTQIVQWVNVSFAVFDKSTGATLAGPLEGNTLWSALGGACANDNDGDIIAQWDKKNHRWLLSQPVFSGPPYYSCIAVSTSPDALGSYYLYQYPQGSNFPDYPKFGVWSNGYYQSQNMFQGNNFLGPKLCAYQSSKLLVGDNTALQICFQLSPGDGGAIPADIDSSVPPPGNEDEFFSTIWDPTHMSVYSLHADYTNPNNSFVTGNNGSQLITVPAFTPACNGGYGGDCVPQKGVSDQLEVLGDRALYRIAYWDDTPSPNVTATPPIPPPFQHWFVLTDVQANGGNQAPRWYEFISEQKAVVPTQLSLFQSGTWAPDSSNNRWFGSIARDKVQNVLLGYSISSSAIYPSIAIAGREYTDPLGTFEPEVMVLNGTGSQIGTADRWGDYSAMRIDADGCTFWYTTQFYMVTAQFDWSTQVFNAKFANCH